MSLSEHAVHDALASLINPDTGRDYVSSHCVKQLKITGSDVSLTIAEGALTPGHAKVLLGVAAQERDLLAARVVAQGLSVRALEKLVAGVAAAAKARKKEAAKPLEQKADDKGARQLKFLADRMQQELGTKVMLSPSRLLADGKREMGRIVIEFFDNEDLSRLLETLNLGDLS